MSESKKCVIQSCKTTIYNKAPGVIFYSLPIGNEMRNRWLSILKTRCSSVDWIRSRICSKHFENKCFDSQRKLKDNAIPTMFAVGELSTLKNIQHDKTHKTLPQTSQKTKVDRLLNNLTQQELLDDVKHTLSLIKMPATFPNFITEDLKCEPNTPTDIQLCLLIKKQDHLITRLTQQVMQNKKHVEVLQKNMAESRIEKKELEQAVETHKYIAKCLQEKQATLEEQIEILTAVESR